MEKMAALKRLMERINEKLRMKEMGNRCIKYNNEIAERNKGLVKNLF